MANEYRLSYTAAEIDEKLGKIDALSELVENSSTTADWNAKEGEAGYVKNRTHWVEEGRVTVIDNQTFEFDNGYFYGEFTANNAIKDGQVVTVILDGVTYNDQVCYGYDGGWGVEIYSNSGDHVGYVEVFTEDGVQMIEIGTDSGTGKCTITLYYEGEVVHHLDPKYIKDMYGEDVQTLIEYPTVKVFAEGNGGSFYAVSPGIQGQPKEGDIFTVNWDGEEYTCEFVLVDEFACLAGNTNILEMGIESNNDMPFVLGYVGEWLLGTKSTAETHTVGITKKIVHKIPAKYLPSASTVFYFNNSYGKTLFKDKACGDSVYSEDVDEAISNGVVYIRDATGGNIYTLSYISCGASGYAVHVYDYTDRYYTTQDFSAGAS